MWLPVPCDSTSNVYRILHTKQFAFPNASANELTQAALDSVAKILEYKITAVKVDLVN
jgi:hypothetical protein